MIFIDHDNKSLMKIDDLVYLINSHASTSSKWNDFIVIWDVMQEYCLIIK